MVVSEENVRFALRYLEDDRILARSELAGHLQKFFSTKTRRDAVILAADGAFRALQPSAAVDELRSVVFAGSVERPDSHGNAAEALGLSVRSYFRKRQRAIMVIASYLNSLLDGVQPRYKIDRREPADLAPAHSRGSWYNELFNSVKESFQLNRRLGDGPAMENDLSRIAGFQHFLPYQARVELRIMLAEADVYAGRSQEASKALEAVFETLPLPYAELWRKALLVKACLAFSVGQWNDADRICDIIENAVPKPDEMNAAAAVIRARICSVRGIPCPASVVNAAPAEWLHLVEARQDIRVAQMQSARAGALELYAASIQEKSLPVATHAAAIVAASYSGSNGAERDVWALRALSVLAACGANAYISRDLFQFGSLLTATTQWFCERTYPELGSIYLTLVPDSECGASSELIDVLPALLNAVLLRVHGRDAAAASVSEDIMDKINAVSLEHRTVTGVLAREISHLSEFGRFLSVLIPLEEQASFVRRFASAAGITVRAIIRSAGYQRLRALTIVS